MEAAAVLRGEKTMEDITFKFEDCKDVYGSRLPRPTALPKVCGLTDFGDAIALKMPEGVAYLAPVMAGVPHARIRGIDLSEAEAMPGVIKVLTAKDVKGTNDTPSRPLFPGRRGTARPKFPSSPGRRSTAGRVVAVVAADTGSARGKRPKKSSWTWRSCRPI
jgi:aldehyde oxidoreductase